MIRNDIMNALRPHATASVPTIHVGNVRSRILTNSEVLNELDKQLSVQHTGAEYMREAKPGFDGYWHPLDLINGTFPTGLVNRVKKIVPHAKVIDDRKRPPHFPLNENCLVGITLTEIQMASIWSILDTPPEYGLHGRGVIGMSMGCHPKGTKVLMFDGSTKSVEEVSVDDLLMGPDSKPRKILQLVRGNGPIVEIKPIKGEKWKANLDHVLTLVKTNVASSPKYECQKGNKIIDVSIREWMEWPKTKKDLYKLFRTGVEFQHNTDPLPIDPYFLGVIIGDGAITIEPRVCKPDPEIKELVEFEAKRWGLQVKLDKKNQTGVSYRLTRGNIGGLKNPLTEALRALKLFGCDSAQKFVPNLYKTRPRTDRLELLAGLLDTDGYYNGRIYEFSSKSETLSKDVAYLCRSVGLMANIRSAYKYCQTGNGGIYWIVVISGHLDSIPCRIKRKKALPRRQKKNVLRTGFTIDHIEVSDYFGFKLSDDGRYLLDDFTVTHNSGKSECGIALGVLTPGKCVVIVHSRDLLHQWRERIGLRAPAEKVAILGDGHWDDFTGRPDTRFVIVIPNTALQDLKLFREQVRDATTLVLDEVHRTGAATKFYAVAQSVPAYYRMGLTGTPCVEDDVRDRRFEATTGRVLIRVKAGELIRNGALCPVKVYYHPIRNAPTGADTFFDIRRKLIEDNTTRNGKIVDLAVQASRAGKPCLILCDTKRHVRTIVETLRGTGVRCRVVTGSHSSRSRSEAKKELRTGAAEVVCATIWHDALDIPELQSVIIAAGGAKAHKAVQRVGRVLRKHVGKSYGEVHDFMDMGNRYTLRHSMARMAACKAEGFEIVSSYEQTIEGGGL